MSDAEEAREAILQRTAAIRPKGHTDEQWLADLAEAHRRGYGIKWEEREAKFLREFLREMRSR